jgi:hypothetical protein
MAMLPKKPKAERLNTRAEKTMVRAKSAYAKAQDAKQNLDTSSQQSVNLGVDYANAQARKAERLGNKANKLKARSKEVAKKAAMRAETKKQMAKAKGKTK